MTRIVLAYPLWLGGPDVCAGPEERMRTGGAPAQCEETIAWLAEQHAAEIVTVMLDVGQGRELEALRDRALAAGASRAHVLDVADEFGRRFLLPALKAGALHRNGRASTTGLARMLTAQKLVEVAAIEQTTNVAHGYPDGDRRVAAAVQALDPRLIVVAVPTSVLDPSPGQVVAPSSSAPAGQSEAPFVELTFAHGAPTAINGVAMSFTDLVDSIEMLARNQRPGPTTHRDSPAAMVLHNAHRGLQQSVIPDPSELEAMASQYGELIDTGAWFSTARQELDAAVDRLERPVSGTVRLQLSNDACRIVEIRPLEKLKVRT